MQPFALVGADAEAALERLLAVLPGRIGVVRTEASRVSGDGGAAVRSRAATRYDLTDGWRGGGDELTVRSALERLAPDHAYAAVIGETTPNGPTIAVGAADEVADDELDRSAPTADALDVDATVADIDDAEPFETLESLVAAVKRSQSAERAGAIATFTGRVRARDGTDDPRTRFLEFEKYEGVAERTMRTIETDLEARDGVLDVRLHHRTGRVEAGEDIVFVVVLAGHRREAFRTVEDGIDRLKDEVPLFKKEVTEAETFWVHERE